MVTYDVEVFKNLLYRLHTLIQTSITFFDENFEGTVACTSPMNPLCRLIKDHEAFRCAETDKTELAYCKCSNCPDHYCMARGMCSSGTQIVCLPNGLIIQFLEAQPIDAVIG